MKSYIFVLMAVSTVCVAQQFERTPTPMLGKVMSVDTGGNLFFGGSYSHKNGINIPEAVSVKIPGSFGVRFPVTIAPGVLTLRVERQMGKFYCDDSGRSTATFRGKSVVTSKDCIGLLVEPDGSMSWVVDNSIRNGEITVWTKKIPESEWGNYRVQKTDKLDDVKDITYIVYDGYFGKQLHFTLKKVGKHDTDNSNFTFDFDGSPIPIGILGYKFEVIRADNMQLVYRWISINERLN